MGFLSTNRHSRVALVVDTPNITKSIINRHGPRVRPDYASLIRFAKSLGNVTAAVALVNDGVNPAFSNALTTLGFQVRLSHAFDCDDAVVAWAVRLHSNAECIVICSGDHGYCPLVQLLKAIHRKIVLCAVSGSCNRRLRSLSDRYLEVPSYIPGVNRLPARPREMAATETP